MFTQPQAHFVLGTLLGARRHFRRQSREWSTELQHCCASAGETARSLRGRDRKTQLLTILGICGRFLRETYLRRPLLLLQRGLGKRNAWFMIAGHLPLLTALAMILFPAMVFDSPHSEVYYFFARNLAYDWVSLLPIVLGLITITLMLRFPADRPSDEESNIA